MFAIHRRMMFAAGALAVLAPGAASAAMTNEAVARRWYKLWVESRDWAQFDAMLTDDFTFTAASGEDHISKAKFKTECWDNQNGHMKGFDLVKTASTGDDIFVKYVGLTVGGNKFRNVELLKIRDGKIASIECYFGATGSYPTAVDAKKG